MTTYTREIIVHAESEPALEALLALHGVVAANPDPNGRPLPRNGLGLDWMGQRSISGVPLSARFCHLWVTQAGMVSDAEWEDLIDALHDRIWVGPQLQALLAQPGPQLPHGVTWIRWERKRRQLTGGFPLVDPATGNKVWWHSDFQSRDQQSGLMMAGVIAILKAIVPPQAWAQITAAPMINPSSGQQQTWSMMSGEQVPLSVGKMFDLLMAAMGQEGATFDAANAAIAAYEAGELNDMSSIQWPEVYEA